MFLLFMLVCNHHRLKKMYVRKKKRKDEKSYATSKNNILKVWRIIILIDCLSLMILTRFDTRIELYNY